MNLVFWMNFCRTKLTRAEYIWKLMSLIFYWMLEYSLIILLNVRIIKQKQLIGIIIIVHKLLNNKKKSQEILESNSWITRQVLKSDKNKILLWNDTITLWTQITNAYIHEKEIWERESIAIAIALFDPSSTSLAMHWRIHARTQSQTII